MQELHRLERCRRCQPKARFRTYMIGWSACHGNKSKEIMDLTKAEESAEDHLVWIKSRAHP